MMRNEAKPKPPDGAVVQRQSDLDALLEGTDMDAVHLVASCCGPSAGTAVTYAAGYGMLMLRCGLCGRPVTQIEVAP